MKASLLIALACSCAAPFSFAQTVPEIPFESVRNLLKLPPDIYLGEAAGVAINSKKHIFVFSRGNTTGPAYGATAAQVLEFDPNGKFIREIGHNLYAWSFAHAVRFDKDDNLWAIDKGSDMIIKFNPEGRVDDGVRPQEGSLRRRREPWTRVTPPRPAVDGQFRQPTDVTWDPEGNIFISDGYINSRVAKFDKNGDWVKQWGTPGNGPGQFNTPHSIAADAKGNIYVADRGNRRIQVFDHDGNFLRDHPDRRPRSSGGAHVDGRRAHRGRPAGSHGWRRALGHLHHARPGTQYLYSADAFPGRIYKLSLDGKVLGMLGSMGRQLKQFGWIHEIACPSENEIYAGEILNWRVQKLVLHPGK